MPHRSLAKIAEEGPSANLDMRILLDGLRCFLCRQWVGLLLCLKVVMTSKTIFSWIWILSGNEGDFTRSIRKTFYCWIYGM